MNPDYTLDDPKEELLAEIYRLREMFKKAEQWNQFCELQIKNVQSFIEEQNQLCLRAADALDESTGNLGIVIPPAVNALIAELREAVK